ncbi:MAG: hypothetical protein ACK56I_35050 [bacterium]
MERKCRSMGVMRMEKTGRGGRGGRLPGKGAGTNLKVGEIRRNFAEVDAFISRPPPDPPHA